MTNEQDDSDIPDQAEADRGPTVLRISLGSRLRRLREACGISREDAGDHIRGSHAKISRLELGRTRFRERDLLDLLKLYGVEDQAELDVYLDLMRKANDPGWWQPFNDVLPQWFETYLGLEQAATTIRTYEAQFVPGLLQTEAYARAVIRLANEDETERRVGMRMRRQEILSRASAPTVWAVVDENALRRPVGGYPVLRGQIEHLIAVSERPNVKIQVLPYSVGGHPAAGGSFSILRFPEPELADMVYMEQLTTSAYLEKKHEVEVYMTVMNKLSVIAPTPGESRDFLRRVLGELPAE
ncbi:helix-turn-helix transcriptional regulator [Nocardia sp. NPDC024068]|uniref:helix-turn-helix domain-containing protein n=1 Tax=Nocardia sp. NPDC024068 TaxID=3157197 RepID=UPI0034000A8C